MHALYIGGDSKTLMVVQVAPVKKNVRETMSSLEFAKKVGKIELGKVAAKTAASKRKTKKT